MLGFFGTVGNNSFDRKPLAVRNKRTFRMFVNKDNKDLETEANDHRSKYQYSNHGKY